jgi:ribosome-binding protein aMBF1 (putative translation factor)
VARRVKEPVATVKASAMAKFANQLRGWRLKLGWSQAELAAKLGYSNALVSQGVNSLLVSVLREEEQA